MSKSCRITVAIRQGPVKNRRITVAIRQGPVKNRRIAVVIRQCPVKNRRIAVVIRQGPVKNRRIAVAIRRQVRSVTAGAGNASLSPHTAVHEKPRPDQNPALASHQEGWDQQHGTGNPRCRAPVPVSARLPPAKQPEGGPVLPLPGPSGRGKSLSSSSQLPSF